MSFVLGGTTLPTPQGFTRKPILIAFDVQTLSGKTNRDYVRKKYKYVLNYTFLSQAEVSTITTLYSQDNVLVFSVDEGNLQVSSADVLMNISNREYNLPGGDFREDIDITLTEV